jgi:oxalate decarboxylase/phosphoglucose isomerase-like protein (cupin superfamily)
MINILSIFICLAIAQTTKAQSALQERQKLEPKDFVFDRFKAPLTVGSGGQGNFMTLDTFPALKNMGVSASTFDILPCGIILPHVHPRGNEIFYVLRGGFLTGFLEENGGRYIENNITVGQAVLFPQGLIHYVQNLGCQNATFLAMYSHEDAGGLTISTRMFDITNQQALTSTFNQPESVINQIRASVRPTPASGVGECRRRCGLGPAL